jgi:hypothetical protein
MFIGIAVGPQQLIEFGMDGLSIAVYGALNEIGS